jgi:hypothetical protein
MIENIAEDSSLLEKAGSKFYAWTSILKSVIKERAHPAIR